MIQAGASDKAGPGGGQIRWCRRDLPVTLGQGAAELRSKAGIRGQCVGQTDSPGGLPACLFWPLKKVKCYQALYIRGFHIDFCVSGFSWSTAPVLTSCSGHAGLLAVPQLSQQHPASGPWHSPCRIHVRPLLPLFLSIVHLPHCAAYSCSQSSCPCFVFETLCHVAPLVPATFRPCLSPGGITGQPSRGLGSVLFTLLSSALRRGPGR